MIRARLMAAALGALGLGALAAPLPAAARARAEATRTLGVRDEGHLRFGGDSATTIFDHGALSGTIPGQARVAFVYNGSPNVTARFTIYAVGGSIYGQAKCRLHDPASPTPSFRGALAITGGSGRYAHAHGSGELYGVFYRHGYGLNVQARGTLRY
jgi:hypothetical protein